MVKRSNRLTIDCTFYFRKHNQEVISFKLSTRGFKPTTHTIMQWLEQTFKMHSTEYSMERLRYRNRDYLMADIELQDEDIAMRLSKHVVGSRA